MAARDELDGELQRFLSQHVHCYEELESLIVLHQDRTRQYTAPELGARLKIPEAAAQQALENLHERGLLGRQQTSVYRYQPQVPELDELVTRLSQAYQHTRWAVVQTMTRNSLERLRTSAMHTFAEAFRIRPNKKNG
jgi:predicted transcriptional regulator